MLLGLILHIINKVLFVLSGYIIHIVIGKVFGPELYGVFGIILTINNINYLLLNNGLRQAASVAISKDKYNIYSIVKKCIIIQLLISFILFLLNVALSDYVGVIFNDNRFINYVRFSSIIIPFVGLYFVFTGILNGQKCFAKETTLMNIYAILRLSGIALIFFIFKDKIYGIITGFIFAAFICSILGLWFVRGNFRALGNSKEITYKELWNFAFPIIIFFAGTNLLMNIDSIIVKKAMIDNYIVGIYTAAVNIGKAPYFFAFSFAAVLLPYVSEAYNKGNLDKARDIIRQIVSLIFVIASPVLVLVSLTSKEIIMIMYSEQYVNAAQPMSILLFSMVFLVTMVIFNIILSGVNKQKISIYIIFIVLAIDVMLLNFLVNVYGLVGAALSNLISAFVGMIISGYFVNKNIQRCFNFQLIGKLITVIFLFYLSSYTLLNFISLKGFLNVMIYYSICSIIYLLLILIFKVYGKSDIISILGNKNGGKI